MKVKEIIKLIEEDGWFFARSGKGSHKVYKHPTKKGNVIISDHKGDVPKGTLNKILKQAGLK